MMDLEKLTIQELVKMEGFTERCQAARRFPLATMMVTASRDRSLAEIVDKLPSILVTDEEQFIARLAGLEAEGGQNMPAKKDEVKPAVEPAAVLAAKAEEQKPAAEPVIAVAKAAAKPAEGNRGAGRPPKAAAIPAGEIPDFDKLTNPELRDFCVKNSVIARIKKDMGNSKRESMIKWCKEHFGEPTAAAKPAADKPADKPAEAAPAAKDEKPAGPVSPYEGLTAKELFCICKDRGLTVAERQEVNVYMQALEIDDAAREAAEKAKAAEEAEKQTEAEKPAEVDITAVPVPEPEEETEEFDDWDLQDDDPTKAAEPTPAAGDDDDDDWDI